MNTPATWTQLLQEAVSKPSLLLKAYGAFHNYSVGNQLLAIVQCGQRGIEPGPLSTYPGWVEKGRQVRKGERALTLCMPLTFKNKERQSESDPSHFLGFAYKPRWFVISQTDGEPVTPTPTPEWERSRALVALNVTETAFDTTNGNVQGFARERTIAVSPLAALPHKTTFHELGHVLLGHTAESSFSDTETTPRNLREVEAEAVALICCETLELPGAEYARGYIQNWNRAGEPIPEASAQKIFRAADLILKAGAGSSDSQEDFSGRRASC
jgi:antirestriction protein ArdC